MSAVGRRYAKALLEIAVERSEADAIARQLADLSVTWAASRELRDVFESPAYSQEMRRSVVQAVCSKSGISKTLVDTLRLLSDRRRMRYVPDVADAYRTLSEEAAGRVSAEVVTATSMPESYFTELQATLEKVTQKRVVLKKREDPALIGGVIARVGDKVFDGSLRTRLDELKDELLNR